MLPRTPAFLMIAALVSGCFGYTVSSEVPEQFDEVRAQIVVGQTPRGEVHARLGEPFISDERLEMYRVLSGHDVALIGPVVPVTWESHEYIIYSLVIYDEAGVVEAVDWDLYKSGFAEVFGGTVRDKGFRSASLRAGGYRFESFKAMYGSKDEILLGPPSAAQEMLPPPAGMCALYVVPLGPYLERYEFYFYLDGELLFASPVFSNWLAFPVFAKVLIPAGDHEFKVDRRTSVLTKSIDVGLDFSCESGSTWHLYPEIEKRLMDAKDIFGGPKYDYDGEVILSDSALEPLDRRQRILFYNGWWFGEG